MLLQEREPRKLRAHDDGPNMIAPAKVDNFNMSGREAFLNPGFDGFECHLVTKLNQSGGFTQGEEAGRLSMAWST